MHELSTTGTSTHPVLSIVGKWHREHMASNDPPPPFVRGRPRPILVVGAGGVLGRAIVRTLTSRRLPCAALLRSALDIAERSQVDAALAAWDPWAVINAAGYVRVDDAEQSVEECRRSNVDGARTLALACQARGIRLLTFSSDLVFSGAKGDVYLEDDPVDPLGVYGASQADAERAVLALQSDALIVRTSAFFGSDDGSDFVARATATVRAGERFQAANDVVVSPTYVPQLVDATLDLLVDGERGVVHLAGTSQIDWASLARSAVERVGLNAELVEPVPHDELGWRARRPAFSALGSTRTAVMTSLPEALDRMAREGPPSS
jgi:dTDP-4-dehydrorhamnose reductase